MGLGVEPTVYLDEKKRFLEALAQIRRINHGPDQNDSSGYGLYLVRLPVSITPGECTYQGYGAEIAVTAEHEFPPDFLQSAFRNLVINDLVDQLGPVVYEVIRSGRVDELETLHYREIRLRDLEARRKLLIDQGYQNFVESQRTQRRDETDQDFKRQKATSTAKREVIEKALTNFLTRDPATYPTDGQIGEPSATLHRRFEALEQALRGLRPPGGPFTEKDLEATIAQFDGYEKQLLRWNTLSDKDRQGIMLIVGGAVDYIRTYIQFPDSPTSRVAFEKLFTTLYETAFDNDRHLLDDALNFDQKTSKQFADLSQSIKVARATRNHLKFSLPSTRNPKQRYPIAPQESLEYFLEGNVYQLAKGAKDSLLTRNPRATDVRNYLRHTFYVAYEVMARPRQGVLAPLDDIELMKAIHEAVEAREFGPEGRLRELFRTLAQNLAKGRKNLYREGEDTSSPILAACWAIAVDASLLDYELREWIPKTLAAHDVVCTLPDEMHFYYQDPTLLGQAPLTFQEFVKYKWPIITFALDPVTDQQNIADSFSLQRDLQLALSFAFATGQINFSQMNTFRRQIQQSSDTIALNRTVTGFIHSNDHFGFRFTPRFQNPPNQRTNLGVIASQLIGGGPGPDYQTKKSKLESGIRELTAILLVPTFLPTMRMEVSSNWFKLNDPEHLIFHTRRMLEQGRQVQELRKAVFDACSEQQYRPADVKVLPRKLSQLEAMLPAQSKVIQLPFENTASGFELFSDGATALVPVLSGYDGVDAVTLSATTTPTANTNTDIFIYGKYFDLLDTRVIVGGAYIPSFAIAGANAATSGGFEIISREVAHVIIPTNVQQTVTYDGQTYLEVYLATPSGISNRVLVPFQAPAPSPPVAFDLSPGQELDVYYQWFPRADTNAKLIATNDPGGTPIKIKWDASTSMAPKTLLATFTATVGTQSLTFALPANSGTADEYQVDSQLMTVILLKRLQSWFPAPTALPAQIPLKVSVQPYVPQDAMGYRVLSKAKDLKTPLTVKFLYNATDKDALPNVMEPPPPAKPQAKKAAWAEGLPPLPSTRDNFVRPTSLSPNVSTTGMRVQIPPPFTLSELTTDLQGIAPQPPPMAGIQAAIKADLTAAQTNLTSVASTLPTPAQLQAQIPAVPSVPSVVVNPQPVTVIAPTTVINKPKSRLLSIFHRKKGQAGNAASAP